MVQITITLYSSLTSEAFEELQTDIKVVAGDFNLPLQCDIDKKGGNKETHTISRQAITACIDTHNMIDAWREWHPDKFLITWKRLQPTQGRIQGGPGPPDHQK